MFGVNVRVAQAISVSNQWVKVQNAPILILSLILTLSGCSAFSSLSEPNRLFPVEGEFAWIKKDDPIFFNAYLSAPSKQTRNDFITSRMYAIDIAYTSYEANLTHEGQEANFLATVASLGVNGAATLVPVLHTKNLLNQVAMGITGTDTAYNEQLLLKQTIQHIQTAMRTGRYEQAAIILSNMQCEPSDYPIGMALSDLELYYRAGTLTSGLMKVTENVTNANSDAKATNDTQKPGAAPAGAAKLAANATEAKIKAQDASAKSCVSVGNGTRRLRAPGRQ
jgi:hypothetical protein